MANETPPKDDSKLELMAKNAKEAFTSDDNKKGNTILILITMVFLLIFMFFPFLVKIFRKIYQFYDKMYRKHLDPILDV
tara:strand:+ start:965 stop:1201 length:237 start_codon:yes stop_codon:yes gene_type:complete